jgi:dipeptidyl aminopeptidase/acylaminoacyl peptidase
MPDVQEVFRMATEKVKPDPNALERQMRRQRKTARGRRTRAYLVAAAVIAAAVAGAFAIRQAAGHDTTPGGSPTPAPPEATFTTTLPGGAQAMTPTMFDLQGHASSTIQGLPPNGYSLSYAADGRAIAFIASDDLDVDHLGVIGAGGGTPTMIPTPRNLVVGSTVGIGTVAISPDGTRLAFEALDGGNSDIYVVNVDGSGLTRLTTDPATDQYPQWSPDGSTIVYDNAGAHEDSDPQFSKTSEIFTVPANGSAGPTQLTNNSVADAAPAYSPDGRRIAFMHDGDNQIWTMAADGSDQRRVGNTSGFSPRWSPDGSTIAFTEYSAAYRPMVAMGSQYATRPLVITRLVDVATGEVTTMPNAAMASDYNTPQWMGARHLLILRVPAKG